MILKKKKKLNIPKFPRLIIDTLKSKGFDAYIVGGCVRDQLLGLKPSDFDITTNAKPEDIKKLFKKTIDTGIKHGTVSVLFYENNVPHVYEVTTYRVDGRYSDGRHPENVTFVDDLREDLRRRDFTVNAMAYNDDIGLVDEFDGLSDLNNKIIRAVGNPIDRFQEDALRLLRAVRFAAKLGFDIEKETARAIPVLASNLRQVSRERVQVELTKTITSKNPDYIKLVKKYGLDRYICDGFDKIRFGKFDKEPKNHMAYASLLYNTEPDFAKNILKELKLDNNTIAAVTSLINAKEYYYRLVDFSKKTKRDKNFDIVVKESIDYLKYDLTHDFIKLLYINEGKNKTIAEYEKKVKEFETHKIPIFIKDLDIDGSVIKDIGFTGEEVGAVLKNLQKIVYNNYRLNNRKVLKDIVEKAYNIYTK